MITERSNSADRSVLPTAPELWGAESHDCPSPALCSDPLPHTHWSAKMWRVGSKFCPNSGRRCTLVHSFLSGLHEAAVFKLKEMFCLLAVVCFNPVGLCTIWTRDKKSLA